MKIKPLLLLFMLFRCGLSNAQFITYLPGTPKQRNTKLDGRNGFKDFKFGVPISQYKDCLSPMEDNVEELELSCAEPSSLFGLKWSKFYALAEQGKLKSVAVFWQDSEVTFSTLLKNLETLYGEAYTPETRKLKKSGLEVKVWQGNRIKMMLYRDTQSVSPMPCSNCKITLVVYCMKFPDSLENDF